MSKYSIWFPLDCLETIQSYSDNASPKECGGILFGYINQNDIVVRDVSGPGVSSKATKTSFYPDQDFDLKLIESRFNSTDGVETYIGDWHSHPAGDGRLSYTDKLTLKRTARKNEFWPVSIMLILSSESGFWQPEIYLALKKMKLKCRVFISCGIELTPIIFY